VGPLPALALLGADLATALFNGIWVGVCFTAVLVKVCGWGCNVGLTG
jgi:hypothetical protein